MIEKFERTGSVLDDNESRTGRPVTVTTPQTVERVKALYEDSPTTSQRKAAKQLGLCRSTLRKIMDDMLNLFPYKIQTQQPLTEQSEKKRLDFANEMLERIRTKKMDYKKIWFTDEAHFQLDGYVNKQNYRHWGTQNPHLGIARPLHPKRVTVWCAISYGRIIGPIFLTDSITGPVYKEQILEKSFRTIRRLGMIKSYWFQQDGARPHSTDENLGRIAEVFQDRIIGLGAPQKTGGGIDWPPYSPDINVCDFFLWGAVKDKVYANPIQDLEMLKDRITEEIQAIPEEQIHAAIENFYTRIQHLVAIDGRHFENLIH